MSGYDYAHNPVADANRSEKARALARWCWEHGITADELRDGDDRHVNKAARLAQINAPSPETVAAAAATLEAKEAWAAAHPTAPGADPGMLGRPDWWPPAGARPALTVVPDLPADDAAEWVKPRGWDALAALGPINRPDAPCTECGAAPVVLTPKASHCAAHPPQPGRPGHWGAHLNWTPDASTGKCATYGRQSCYCGRCQHHPRPESARGASLAVAR